MSLLSAIRQSAASLQVAQTGLQVVGNNIANASTPGYIRQELLQSPTDSTRIGGLLLGSGVRATGIRQRFDAALLARMIEAGGRTANATQVASNAGQLEIVLGELGDDDLSSKLSAFSSAWQDLAQQPASNPLRQLVLSSGKAVADELRRQASLGQEQLQRLDGQVVSIASEINRLANGIAALNQRIVDVEAGRTLQSDAGGLRDERWQLMEQLGRLVQIDAREQPDGTVNILVGGDILVTHHEARQVIAEPRDRSGFGQTIKFRSSDSPLQSNEGELAGIYRSREELVEPFLSGLAELARELAFAVNRVHAEGQGSVGFQRLVAGQAVAPDVSIDQTELGSWIHHGSFDLLVLDGDQQLLRRATVNVNLLDPNAGTTLAGIAEQLDAIEGVQASVDSFGRLMIAAEPGRQFAFAEDTSGLLAALGINVFFVGSDASTLSVAPQLLSDPSLLAVSRGGVGADFENLVRLVGVIDQPVPGRGDGLSLRERYEQFASWLTQQTSHATSVAEGQQRFEDVLRGEFLASSSVNLDEETIRMLAYQRTYQASAKVISTANELFDTLMQL